jgi:hypothetical protein
MKWLTGLAGSAPSSCWAAGGVDRPHGLVVRWLSHSFSAGPDLSEGWFCLKGFHCQIGTAAEIAPPTMTSPKQPQQTVFQKAEIPEVGMATS